MNDVDSSPQAAGYAASTAVGAPVRITKSPGRGLGVFAIADLVPSDVPLVQYGGRVIDESTELDSSNDYIFSVFGFDTCTAQVSARPRALEPLYWIDGRDPSRNTDARERVVAARDGRRVTLDREDQQPTWARYVNSVLPGAAAGEQNCAYCEADGRIYLRVIRPIRAGAELLVDYGEAYWMVRVDSTRFVNARSIDVGELTTRVERLVGDDADYGSIIRWTTNPELDIFFLFEPERADDVGVVVVAGTRIELLFSIRVLNDDAVRRRLVALVDDLMVIDRRGDAMMASIDVFGGAPVRARALGFVQGAQGFFERRVSSLDVRVAAEDDVEYVFGDYGPLRDVRCAAVWRTFNEQTLLGEGSDFEPIVIERTRDAQIYYVGVAVRQRSNDALLVVCTFGALSEIQNEDIIQRMAFMRVVDEYERAHRLRVAQPDATVPRRFAVYASESTEQALWLRQRGYSRPRRRAPISVVPSSVYFERAFVEEPAKRRRELIELSSDSE